MSGVRVTVGCQEQEQEQEQCQEQEQAEDRGNDQVLFAGFEYVDTSKSFHMSRVGKGQTKEEKISYKYQVPHYSRTPEGWYKSENCSSLGSPLSWKSVPSAEQMEAARAPGWQLVKPPPLQRSPHPPQHPSSLGAPGAALSFHHGDPAQASRLTTCRFWARQ